MNNTACQERFPLFQLRLHNPDKRISLSKLWPLHAPETPRSRAGICHVTGEPAHPSTARNCTAWSRKCCGVVPPEPVLAPATQPSRNLGDLQHSGHLWALGKEKETYLHSHLMDETAPGGRRDLFQSTYMSSSDGETHRALVLDLV